MKIITVCNKTHTVSANSGDKLHLIVFEGEDCHKMKIYNV